MKTQQKEGKKKNYKNKPGFIKFLTDRAQCADWLLLVLVCVAGYFVIKSGYPYPLTMTDSGGYIQAAATDTFFFYRPFGYSMLLQIFHAVSYSLHAIFVGQMLLYFIAVAAFSFTVKYFFTPANRIVWYILLFLFAFSPMAFILANCIMSDLLFGVEIYMLLASLVFILKKHEGQWIALIIFIASLFCALHTRYSAMIFPVVFIACFLFLKGKIRIASIAGALIVTFIFHAQVKNLMKETTGFNQFSTGFDGWQLANNALHVLPYVNVDSTKITNKRLQELHRFIAPYSEDILEKTQNGTRVTAKFLWNPDMPLKQFLQKKMSDMQRPYAHLWIKLGSTTYREYGQYLVLKYPWKFMRYYYFPNVKHVFFLTSPGVISSEVSVGSQHAYEWYKLDKSQDLSCKNPFYKGFAWKFMQVSWVLGWIFILILSVWAVLWRKRIRFDSADKIVFWSIFAFGVIYYASTVFASPIEDRYWVPMGCVHFAFCYILLNKLIACMQPVSLKNSNDHPNLKVEEIAVQKLGKGKKRNVRQFSSRK